MAFLRIQVNSGDVAVVMGPGPMGLLVAQVLKSKGATVVVTGLDNDKVRLDKAEALHMDYVVNCNKQRLKNVSSMELQTVTVQMLLLNVQVQFQQHDKVWIFTQKGF